VARGRSRRSSLVWLLFIAVVIVAIGYGGFQFTLKSPAGLKEDAAAAQARAGVRIEEATKQAAARLAAQAEQQRLAGVQATEQARSAAATAVVIDQERSIQRTQEAQVYNVEQTQVAEERAVVATATAVVVHQTQAADGAMATIGAQMATATQRAYEKELVAVPLTATAQYMEYADRAANRRVYGGLVVLLALILFWLIGLTYLHIRGTVPRLRVLEGDAKKWRIFLRKVVRRVDELEQRWEGHDAVDLTITRK